MSGSFEAHPAEQTVQRARILTRALKFAMSTTIDQLAGLGIEVTAQEIMSSVTMFFAESSALLVKPEMWETMLDDLKATVPSWREYHDAHADPGFEATAPAPTGPVN